MLLWATLLAFFLSTESLFQPFVWRNFELVDILTAWRGILRDRMIVAICIAGSLAAFGQMSQASLGKRMALQALAIVAGALAGETLLYLIASQDDRQDLLSFLGRIVRWSLVGGSIATLIYFLRSGSELAVAAKQTRIDDAFVRRVAASSQLEMLKRQIEPHFLFNTLATIRRLQETDAGRSQHVLRRLLDYMTATLEERASPSTLGHEIRLVLAYLEVCGARMPDRLTVRCDVADGLEDMQFPPLMLATLVENAIKHGIFPRDGGEIMLSARQLDDMIEVAVADDGVGFGEKAGGSGIGLANIGERLRLLYGARAQLTLAANTPRGIRASVLVPVQAAVA